MGSAERARGDQLVLTSFTSGESEIQGSGFHVSRKPNRELRIQPLDSSAVLSF